MATIDRADWHYGGDFPSGLPDENGATHIGIYLAWIVHRDLGSAMLKEYAEEGYDRVLAREITGRELLLSKLDEKFFPELLTDDAAAFTDAYYGSNEYVNDYDRVLGRDLETLYHVDDTWSNYDTMATVLDDRYRAWRDSHRAA